MTDFRDVIDEVDQQTLRSLAGRTGPCVSIYLPTGRTHHDARRAPLELRALREEAAERLGSTGPDEDAGTMLAPLVELERDDDFWAYQAEGVGLFVDPTGLTSVRLPADLGRCVVVGERHHVVPLVDVADHHHSFYVLAMALGQVRLLSGSWGSLREVDLGPIPASVADMERQHLVEPELQHQHTPTHTTATFHGHGGREVDDVVLEKFVHEVATATRERVGAASTTPLYLAAVEEYLPRLQGTGRLPTLVGRVAAGSPESLSSQDLLERVRPLVAEETAAARARTQTSLDDAVAAGRLATDLGDVARAASEGRVGTLLLDAGAGQHDTVDRAVTDALSTGAEVHSLAPLPNDVPTAAVLRY